jgi:hypothetical protein
VLSCDNFDYPLLYIYILLEDKKCHDKWYIYDYQIKCEIKRSDYDRMAIGKVCYINPLSAMVTIWHHIKVIFKVLAQKGFIGTLISWYSCVQSWHVYRYMFCKCIYVHEAARFRYKIAKYWHSYVLLNFQHVLMLVLLHPHVPYY